MKAKLAIILVAILTISGIVYATQVEDAATSIDPNENVGQVLETQNNENEPSAEKPTATPEQLPTEGISDSTTISAKDYIANRAEPSTLVNKLNNREVYGSNGYNQNDTLANFLSNENGFQEVLMANGIEGIKADINNITFGRVIGACTIDLTALDTAVVDGTLETGVNSIINFAYDKYVEVKYENILLALLNIDSNGSIKKMTEPTMFNNATVKAALDAGSTDQEIFIIVTNKYISGLLVNDGTNEYVLKDNGAGDYTKIELIDALQHIDNAYLANNPRIDYAAIEAQQKAEAAELAERNKKMDTITYSILGALVLGIVAIGIVCWKKFVSIDE